VTWHNVILATFGGGRRVSLCQISQADGPRSRPGERFVHLEQPLFEVGRDGQRVGARQVMIVLVNQDISDYGLASDPAADQ
jgi:hypothetical protein